MNEADLKQFETLRLRPLTIDDFDALIALQLRCFPGMKSWKRAQIASQLHHFPEGQVVIEIEGRIVATASSLIVDSAGHGDWQEWKKSTDDGYIRNHDSKGTCSTASRAWSRSRRLFSARPSC
ncbi:MAG: hypothetical protein ABI024_05630 [Vicinamibacterales bacterium]